MARKEMDREYIELGIGRGLNGDVPENPIPSENYHSYMRGFQYGFLMRKAGITKRFRFMQSPGKAQRFYELLWYCGFARDLSRPW